MTTATIGLPAPRPAALSPTSRAVMLGASAALIWGLYLAMARAGVVAGLAPSDIALLRYGIAGLIMLPWLLRHSPVSLGPVSLAGIPLWRALVMTALVGPPFVLIGVSGYHFAPLAHGAVMQPAALTLTGMGLAAVVLMDRPTRERLLGVAVILSGIAVIAGPALFTGSSRTLIGDALFMSAGAMWAVFTILMKRWSIDPIRSTAVVSVLSAVIYVPLYLAFIGTERLAAMAPATLLAQALVQGVLSGVVAVICFNKAVQLLGPGKAAIFPALVPAVATLVGIPVAGEWPTPWQWSGLAIVSLGLVIVIGWLRLPTGRRGRG